MEDDRTFEEQKLELQHLLAMTRQRVRDGIARMEAKGKGDDPDVAHVKNLLAQAEGLLEELEEMGL